MITLCDNVRDAHDPEIINEDDSAILWYCKQCGAEGRIGKDIRGIPDNYEFNEIFSRWSMQAANPLFYKIYPKYLKE